MDKKLAVSVITTGKSCSPPCFPHSFEYCISPWTWHPETLSYQCVISRNSTAVTYFIKKQQHWNAKCDRSQCKIRWTHCHGFEKKALGCSYRLIFKQPFLSYIALGLMLVSCCTGMLVFNAELCPSHVIFVLEGQWPRKVVNLLAKHSQDVY